MRTIEVKLFTYPELSEKAQEQAREKVRTMGWCADDFRFSAQHMIDNLKEEAAAQGIDVRDVSYEDRSWAFFTVTIEAIIDLAAFMKANKLANRYRALYNVATEKNPDVGIDNAYRLTGHGSGNTVYGQEARIEFSGYNDPSATVQGQAAAVEELIDATIQQMERELAQSFNEELEYCYSDEVIADLLTNNEHEFEENGDLH